MKTYRILFRLKQTEQQLTQVVAVHTAAQAHILQSLSAGAMVKLPTNPASLENVGVDCLACTTSPLKVMEGSLVCTRTGIQGTNFKMMLHKFIPSLNGGPSEIGTQI